MRNGACKLDWDVVWKFFYLTPDFVGLVLRFCIDPALHCVVGLRSREGVTYGW